MTTSERGFTLIEVIVVLSVVAVLAGTAVPLVTSIVDAERRQRTTIELQALPARSKSTTATTRRFRRAWTTRASLART